MKIVVIGCGKIGMAIIGRLCKEGHDIVVIEQNHDVLKKAMETFDVFGIEGNGATVDVLTEAECKNADLVIATTPMDEVNLLSCMCAKKLGAKETIARVRNPEYVDQLSFLGKEFALTMAINPERSATREIARILKFPSAKRVDTFARGRGELVELPVPVGNKLIGLKLSEICGKLKNNVLFCAVRRGKKVAIPGGDFVLEEGDKISITGKRSDLSQFIKRYDLMKERIRRVMIIGGGIAGYYLSKQLIEMGMQVKIIENNKEHAQQISEMLEEASVVLGNGTDTALLEEEGIDDTDALVCLTGNDEVNVMVSLYAKNKKLNKIITKVNDETVKNMLDASGLDTVITPQSITADEILSYVRSIDNVRSKDIVSIHKLGSGDVEALEFVAKGGAYSGKPISELKVKMGALIAMVISGREFSIPNGHTVINSGDTVVAVTKDESINNLEDILGA